MSEQDHNADAKSGNHPPTNTAGARPGGVKLWIAVGPAPIWGFALLFLILVSCAPGTGRIGEGKIFVPRMDFGIAPDPGDFTRPGDCRGGSQLAAVDVAEPEYPRRAFLNGQQAWVAVRLDVAEDGRTRNVKIVEAQPVNSFNGAAKKTVRNWRFEPPQNGPLTRCVVVLDYRFGVGRIGL